MAQYETKFTKLSRYAPHMVADKEERAKKFQHGLAPHIQERVAPFMLEDYSEVYKKALVIERTTLWKVVGTGQPYSLRKRKFGGNTSGNSSAL